MFFSCLCVSKEFFVSHLQLSTLQYDSFFITLYEASDYLLNIKGHIMLMIEIFCE